MLAPEQDLAIGLLFNLVDYAKMQLFGNLFNALTGNLTEPYQSMPRPETVPATGFKASPHDLEHVAGTYAMPRSGNARVYLKHDQLRIEVQHKAHMLEPRALNSFTLRSEFLALDGLEHTFVFSDTGVELQMHTEWGDVEIGHRKETI
jgi:hypothetical protein